jgi:hypothetical protein
LVLLIVDTLPAHAISALVMRVRSPDLLSTLLARERVVRSVDAEDLIDHHLIVDYSEPLLEILCHAFTRQFAKAVIKDDCKRAFPLLARIIEPSDRLDAARDAAREKVLEYAYRYRSVDALIWLHRLLGSVRAEKLIAHDIVLWGEAFSPCTFPEPRLPDNAVELAICANAINTLEYLRLSKHAFPESLSAFARTRASATTKKWLRKHYPNLYPIFCF